MAGSIVSSASSTDSNAEVDNLSILFRPDASGYGDGSGENAEGEIRTPEGLSAHQISSLARRTGLRYLSGSPSPEPGNTFSPPRRDDRNGATSSSKAITGWTSV